MIFMKLDIQYKFLICLYKYCFLPPNVDSYMFSFGFLSQKNNLIVQQVICGRIVLNLYLISKTSL